MSVYRTTFPVGASAHKVWDVLIRFEDYPDWNPSVPSISGDPRVGSTVALTLAMPGRPSANVKATLVDVSEPERLAWHGNIGADWFFAGDREFQIEPQADGTVRVTHVENVRGAFFPVFRALMGGAIQRHHEAFNEALKERAEAGVDRG